MNLLESLKKHSIIVADTGDIDSIARVKPQDGTTRAFLAFALDSYRRHFAAGRELIRDHRSERVGLPVHPVGTGFHTERRPQL